ncbi:hypothetical protein E2C01_093234 [Portunus trituberculatus]|uniref:Uncharacterized protein n=1 Tax=Portunus trituberculatus TaxID=210409 RepID=A0A5B7JZZ3_PORTR|nr:hypothetical protein [Portunus trituberculatus]
MPSPRPHSLYSPGRNSLTTVATQESAGQDSNRHRDTSRRRFVASKGKQGTNIHPDSTDLLRGRWRAVDSRDRGQDSVSSRILSQQRLVLRRESGRQKRAVSAMSCPQGRIGARRELVADKHQEQG